MVSIFFFTPFFLDRGFQPDAEELPVPCYTSGVQDGWVGSLAFKHGKMMNDSNGSNDNG
jgi:hypothetical protein